MAGKVKLKQLAQDGATNGQVCTFNALSGLWEPQTPASGSSGFPVVGDGPDRQALEARADRLGLADRVRFEGYVPSVAPYLAAADLLVMPSRTEGLPLTLIEALCAGVPVVASAVGGVPGIIQPTINGLLVAPESPSALAGALTRAAKDIEKLERGARDAAEAIRVRFSADRWARETLELYRKIGAEGGA